MWCSGLALLLLTVPFSPLQPTGGAEYRHRLDLNSYLYPCLHLYPLLCHRDVPICLPSLLFSLTYWTPAIGLSSYETLFLERHEQMSSHSRLETDDRQN